MLIPHAGIAPRIDPTAWVAPDATIAGDVTIGANCRVLWGARLIGEGGGRITVGRNAIIMENAVVRATPWHSCTIGDCCLIGPGAHVVGARLGDQVFIATGAGVFHGAELANGVEVRVHATVHLRTRLAHGSVVPIGWIAVGDPAEIHPPSAHEAIWAIQQPLDFPRFVYGFERTTPDLMRHVTERLAGMLGEHRNDEMGAPSSRQESDPPAGPRGELALRTLAMPANTNPAGDVFGGWVMSLMDLAAGLAAREHANGRVVTAAVSHLSFLAPIKVGDAVCCYADVVRTGRTSMVLEVEAWRLPQGRRGERQKVTEAEFTMVAVDEEGRPRPLEPQQANLPGHR